MNHTFSTVTKSKKATNWNQNCTINLFFFLISQSSSNVSLPPPLSFLNPPFPLQSVHRLHLSSQYTHLFSMSEPKLWLAVFHRSALLLKQPENVNRLLRLIFCSSACYTVELENTWQSVLIWW